ncbi:MAG: type I methionyl aminopeptidase [Candidatus Pacebacteria bacterium]|nr:type I methionyl aminopeptidase [Candidatus Paceibacterota bacterium]MCF7862513.1 type I methionyl aminopeptidase [Candidatus Paceibacterota bacterium]
MIIIKTSEEIKRLREGGKRLSEVLHKVKEKVAPGVTAKELDDYAFQLIKEMGDRPAFLNYKPSGAKKPFPASLCVSVNSEVVHGIPKNETVLKEGDIVSIDLGLCYMGVFTDMAMTVPVGKVMPQYKKLMDVTRDALHAGIDMARVGKKVGDIGYAIESFVKPHKYGIVEILSGHGVGRAIHEDPFIPNFGKKGTGEKLVAGMVIAIEPMLNLGTKHVVMDADGYTFRTADGKASAHFEHTILITEGEPEILTA